MKKICKICFEKKDLDKFSKNCVNEDGLSHMCKECCSAYRKFLREKHKKEEKRIQIVSAKSTNPFFVSFD